MVSTRFASLVLGLLYVLHALTDSSAYAHGGSKLHGHGLANVLAVQKEFLDGVPAAEARKIKLRGRKMMVDQVWKKENEKEEELNGETSKISGKDMNASKQTRRSQVHFKDQENRHMLEPKALKSASLGISGKETVHFPTTEPHQFQDSKAVSTKGTSNSSSSRSNKKVSQEPKDAAQKDESQTLVEAAGEIVNLMGKDYGGMDQPRRKPPINNHKPTD